MIDDELDRILQDIEPEQDYLTKKVKHSQKYEEYILDEISDDNKEIVHTPERKEVSLISKHFVNGFVNGIHRHIELSRSIRSRMDIAEIPEQIVPILKKSSYAIFKLIEDIEILSDKCINEINETNLKRRAAKDFPLYFPDDFPDDNRVDFIVLKDTYVLLRLFNSQVKKDWVELEKQTSVFNFSEGGKQLAFQLNDSIAEALQLCKATDILIELIANHLGLLPHYYNAPDAEIKSRIQFSEFKSYALPSILDGIHKDENDNQSIESELQTLQADSSDDSIDEKLEDEKLNPHPHGVESKKIFYRNDQNDASAKQANVFFTVKGSKPWNTRDPYILPIDENVLLVEEEDIEYMVYYSKTSMNEEQIKAELRRALLKLTIDRQKYDIVAEYVEYINKKIISVLQEILEYFYINDTDQWLFYYHLGPQTICRIVLADMQLTGEGYCFSSRDGKKIKKLLPYEFIKKMSLEWCENNINNRDIPFDSVNALDLIRRQVSKKYYLEVDEFVAKIDSYLGTLDSEILKKLDRRLFIKQKALQIYNPKQILIYNRFIDKTIFK